MGAGIEVEKPWERGCMNQVLGRLGNHSPHYQRTNKLTQNSPPSLVCTTFLANL